ncbi:zinc finger protein 6 [Phtheirospermum japonicum]|uniref:Zinc finger protein 6 n=1 Tax=Phtheirospermum japonicum TaxID=374723 RepID=A0A830BJW5_9LAMI|nr:zinc finger protein 6 [Phtheirospermum japonicum]
MAELDYHNKTCNNNTTNGPLKLFGFNMTDQEENKAPPSGSPDPCDFSPSDGRKYECQYCRREKERQQMKRAQMLANRNAAVSFMRNPMVSAFAPPAHLLGPPPSRADAVVGLRPTRRRGAAVPRVAWVCVPGLDQWEAGCGERVVRRRCRRVQLQPDECWASAIRQGP